MGGLERRYNLLQKIKDRGWPSVAVDLGDVMQRHAPANLPNQQATIKYTYAMDALREMGYAAVGFGESEAHQGFLTVLAEYALQHPVPRVVIGNVKDILQFKADQKRISLEVEFAPDMPKTLIGDPTRLNQIVMNLAGNAIKFTEKGGVTILVRSTRPPNADGAKVLLAIDVIDTGIGIPEDRVDRIFEEFTQAYSDTTRKYGGTGLGLTISRRLAQLQGGDVTVKSERDRGSTFTVTIPYAVQ